jgi:hypothetical protein
VVQRLIKGAQERLELRQLADKLVIAVARLGGRFLGLDAARAREKQGAQS